MQPSPFSIDAIIVYVFILITLIVGLRAGQVVKDIKEYAIGNRKFGTIGLLCTYLATVFSGPTILSQTGLVYAGGIMGIFAICGFIFANITTALFIAPNAVKYPDCFTMGDIMKKLYGKYPGIITGILGLLASIMYSGMELAALGLVAKFLLGLPATYSIVIGGIVLTLYSAHGGIKSVVITDILQFVMALIGIPFITYLVVNKLEGIETVLANIPIEMIQITEHKDFVKSFILFLCFCIFPVGMIDPAVIQRMLMASQPSQLRKQYLLASVFDFFSKVSLIIIGLGGWLIYSGNISLEKDTMTLYIINDLLPIGIKGLAIAGFFALIMSTADSFLHIAGLSMVHDVLKPIARNKKKFQKKEKFFSQIATLFAGIFAMGIGLSTTNLFDLMMETLETTTPILLFPLFSGMMGLKTDKKSFFVGMSCTIVVWIGCKIFLPEKYEHFALLNMIIANGIGFFGTHIIKNKGIAIVKQKDKGISLWKPSGKKLMNYIKNILPTPKNIYRYSVTRTEKYGGPYILFGIFFTFHFLLPNFIDLHGNDINKEFLVYLRIFAAILCVLLITKDEWHSIIKPFFPLFWHFTILYCLPFLSTLTLLVAHGKIEWLINIFGTVIFLIVLVDWLSAIIIGLLGVFLACVVYAYYIGPLSGALDFHAGYLLTYQTIFAMALGFFFVRRKERKHNHLSHDNKVLTDKNQHMANELIETARNRRTILSVLREAHFSNLGNLVINLRELQEVVKKQGHISIAKAIGNIHQPLAAIAQKTDAIEERANYMRLQVDQVYVHSILQDVQQQLKSYGIKQEIMFSIKDEKNTIQCDPAKIKAALINAITILSKNNPNSKFILRLANSKLVYPVKSVSEKYKKKTSSLVIVLHAQNKEINTSYEYPGCIIHNYQETKDEEIKLLSEKNHQIILAHYGYIESSSDTYILVIPQILHEVRDKELDNEVMKLGQAMLAADDTYPGAQEQEKELLALVKKHTTIDLENIQEAITEIKIAHGHVRRRSGEPYYLHPIAVAKIVLLYDQSKEAIIAALLHDTIEDTPMTANYIAIKYGRKVSDMVKDVTHLYGQGFSNVRLSNKENIAQLMNHTDKRSLIIKLADRLHNMRTIQHKSIQSQMLKVDETLSFFVPLAKQSYL